MTGRDDYFYYPSVAGAGEGWPRVLSIQSHVVSGYVGNKSATFPLQVLGFEVDPINSVQFSNHTGYGFWKGEVLHDHQLDELIEGLHHNGLENISYVLTGYVGSASFLQRVVELIKRLKESNSDLVYVCDPVMGDNGQLYVPQELLPIYKNMVVPIADIITPNQFEVELLTGNIMKTVEDVCLAAKTLHKSGVQTVVLSSTELGSRTHLLGMASTVCGGKRSVWTIDIPKLPHNFTGTGDLFAALFLAWMSRSRQKVKDALEKTVATLQAVLKRTVEHRGGREGIKHLELQVVQSKADIENPVVTVFAKPYTPVNG